ncbi:MAG: hypothetical protein Q9215_004193 [Flavoplaca cf. flavocitrina]
MAAADVQVQSLVAGLGELGEPNAMNEESRLALLKACRESQYKLESSRETANRLRFAGTDIATAQIFYTIKLFHVLIKHRKSPISTDGLAKETNTDPVLLGIFKFPAIRVIPFAKLQVVRLLRYAASQGMIIQNTPDTWSPSHITYSLAEPSSEANVNEAFISGFPHLVDLPTFLSHNQYRNPSDSTHTVHQFTRKTDKHWFEWATTERPAHYAALNQFMAVNLHAKTGVDVFPFESILPHLFNLDHPSKTTLNPEQTLFIDIGGGIGQICEAFKSRFPSPPSGGRIIVQDLPQTLAGVPAISPLGIEAIPHDFFNPQPIQGARIYYMRHILHDWPDHKCREILQNVKDAMDAESVLLLDDKVVPDIGASMTASALDLSMMCLFASMERTEKQWRALVESMGMRVDGLWTYTEDVRDSVLLVRKD